ncbi:MAG: hypothetical protein LBH59_10015, partial [Planctomycetaceae bacterium]|nr:hypothetical protein [Planctomycetaceae bacterium]
MKFFGQIVVFFSVVVYFGFASFLLFAQNGLQINNGYVATPPVNVPSSNTSYLGAQYTTIPVAQPVQNNVNSSIAPTVYQPAFTGNSVADNNNIVQVAHSPTSLLTQPQPQPNQIITAKALPSLNSAPQPQQPQNIILQAFPKNNNNNPNPNTNYSPFPAPPPTHITPTPLQFTNNNSTINNSVIAPAGFTEPNTQNTTTSSPVVGNSVGNNSATFSSRPVVNNYNTNNTNNNSTSNINVTNNPTSKLYKLQHSTGTELEAKLIKKLGQRFAAVRNLEISRDIAKYRLPVKNDTSLDLTVDRTNGIVTITGMNTAVVNFEKIIRLLDLPESKDGNVTQFITLQNTDSNALRQAVNVINQSGQSNIKLVQNQPTPNPPNQNPAAPSTRFNPNQPATNNQQNENDKTTETNNNNTLDDLTNNGNGSILSPVQVNVVEGLDMYVIMGQPNDVAVVQRMIEQIDKISLEYEPVIELVQIRQADSLRVSEIVQQLYQQIYASRRGAIIIIPLVKPNTILMVGKKENIDTAKELVGKLDLAVDPRSQFKIFRLKNAQAETLQQQIQTFYQFRVSSGGLEQQVNIVADARTNSLIIQANPRDFKEVEAMITQLDVKGSEAKNIVKTFILKNAVASELATTLQNTITGSITGAGNFGGTNAASATQTRNPLLYMMGDKENQTTPPISTLYDIRISADARSNMIIVSAPPDTMILVEMLIKQLDQLPSAESVIKIFTLVNGDAYTITTMLQNLFSNTSTTGGGGFGGTGSTSNTNMTLRRPGIEQDESSLVSVRFVAEVRTNSIIAIGSAGDMTTVETILMRLDEENM